jgi:quercetin dioxygenase-like cupin family protein
VTQAGFETYLSKPRKLLLSIQDSMTVRRNVDVPFETVPGGTDASRQILLGSDEMPNFAMRRFRMEPGGGMPLHTNTVEHGQYVLRGSARVRIGAETVQVSAGDSVFIPANVPHSYEAQGNEVFEFLCVVPTGPDEIQVVEGG